MAINLAEVIELTNAYQIEIGGLKLAIQDLHTENEILKKELAKPKEKS